MRKVIKLFPWKRQVQLFCLQLPIIFLENRFPFFVHILAVICTLFLFLQYSKHNSWNQVFVPQTYKTFTFWRNVMETRPLCLSGKSWSSKKEKKTEEVSKEVGSGVSEYKKEGKRQGLKPCPASLLHAILSLPRLNGEICKMGSYIPDICKFWYTIALFSPVKVHPKVCEFITKLAIVGQIMLKSSLAWKSTPSPVLMVLTNISKGVFMDLCISYHTITFSFLTMG